MPNASATAAAYGTRTAEPGIGLRGPRSGAGAAAAAIRPAPEPRTASRRHAAPDDVADSKGFLGALIMIGTVVSALVFTIVAFKASLTFGVATLLFGNPRSS